MGNGHSSRYGRLWIGAAGLIALLVAGFALKPVLFAAPDAGFVTVDEAMRLMLQEQADTSANTAKAGEKTPGGSGGGGVPKAGKASAEQTAKAAEKEMSEQAAAPGKAIVEAPAVRKPADGQVPEEAKPAPAASAKADAARSAPSKSGGKLNLNQASAEQLDELPGIGPSRAQAIVELRKKLGGSFRSVEQLRDVKGIGEKTLNKLKPLVTVETE